MSMKTALVQLCSGDDPVENLDRTQALVGQAADAGAGFVLTPEVTNCVSTSRAHQAQVLNTEEQDPTLRAICALADDRSIWVLIGSLALKTDDPDGRFANRSFLISPDGVIRARYDKIHMFDVDISETENYRESNGYRPGESAVIAPTPFGLLGLSICYDVRFPHLYRDLAQAGAEVLTVPSAFSPVSGAAHWHCLLRARAIETGSYVLAPAQVGIHPATQGKRRETYGHSLAISPWGQVIAEARNGPGVIYIDLDRTEVAQARQRIPSLIHDRTFKGPI